MKRMIISRNQMKRYKRVMLMLLTLVSVSSSYIVQCRFAHY